LTSQDKKKKENINNNFLLSSKKSRESHNSLWVWRGLRGNSHFGVEVACRPAWPVAYSLDW